MGAEVRAVCFRNLVRKTLTEIFPCWILPSEPGNTHSPFRHIFFAPEYISWRANKAIAGFSLRWLWRPTPLSRCLQMWLSLHIWQALVGGQDMLLHSPNVIWVCSILINHPRKQDSWHFVGSKDLEELEKFLSSWWIRLFSSCTKLLTVERLDKIALD